MFSERDPVVELLAKGEHFGIDPVRLWNVSVVCRSLAHGVSLCPIRAAEVWLPQQDTPLFFNSSRTQHLTIPRGRTQIVKYLYLADYEARRYLGRPITELSYRWDRHGPFDPAILQYLKELCDEDEVSEEKGV